jgi:uncharacterized protein (DUF1778 family)
VQSAVENAQRVIRESQFLDLSQRDRIAFVEAVLNPPAPNEKLKQAAERYRQAFAKS